MLKVVLKRIVKDSSPRETEPFFECMANSMGDAIRQANAKGISCHNLDYNESYPEGYEKDPDWDYEMDLSGLDLKGLRIWAFPCAHSDNYIENANLQNAEIYLVRPKSLSLINCDLRGANIQWEDDFYYLELENSKMDDNTYIMEPEICLCDSRLAGTILEKNGAYMPVDKRVIYFHEVHSDRLEKEILKYEDKIVPSITPECNLIVVKSLKDLPEEIQKAKENGTGVMEFETIKWYYYIYEKDSS